jgi:hypothetical protein
VWPYWLDIGIDHAVEALKYRGLLQNAVEGSDEAKASFLEAECKAGMVAISAAAFALDAFYEATRAVLPGMDELVKTWNRARTPRHARVSETLRRAFRVNGEEARKLHRLAKDYFRFRGWAVHPPADYRTPLLHDVLEVGVEWRFVAFSATNARTSVGGITKGIAQLLGAPRSHGKEFQSWCESGAARVRPRLERSRTELAE